MTSDQPAYQSDNELSISDRPAGPDDDGDLFDLFVSAREGEFAALNWESSQLETFLRGQYAAQQRDYELRFPNADRRLVLLEGQTVGTLWVAHLDDEIRLLDIIVAPEQRGRGIGTLLLNSLKSEAAQTGLPLRHMVARTNPRACQLYERLGIAIVHDAGSHFLMEWLPEGGVNPSSG